MKLLIIVSFLFGCMQTTFAQHQVAPPDDCTKTRLSYLSAEDGTRCTFYFDEKTKKVSMAVSKDNVYLKPPVVSGECVSLLEFGIGVIKISIDGKILVFDQKQAIWVE